MAIKKRKLLIVLIAIFVATSFVYTSASVPSAKTSNSSPAQTTYKKIAYPLKEQNVKLTYAALAQPQVQSQYKTLGNTPFAKEYIKKVGVDIEFIHPADVNAFKLMFASGALPDIIDFHFQSNYDGGISNAINEGIIYPLDSIIQDNAPDLLRTLNSNDEYRRGAITSDKHYIGFPFIRGDRLLVTSSGVGIREDWLTDLKMEIPTTLTEFYNVLTAFKDKKGSRIPLTATLDNLNSMLDKGYFTAAFGIPKKGWYQTGGVVKYAQFQPEWKHTIEYLKKLYENGLLDKNYLTVDSNTVLANITNGISGAAYGTLAGGIGTWMSTVENRYPNSSYSMVGIPTLMSEPGQKPLYGDYTYPLTGQYAVITPKSKHKVTAAKVLNYAYTEEGHMLFNFGIEGESYTMVNGNPVYTEIILNNPKLTVQNAMAGYARAWSNGPFVQDKRYILQYASRPQQRQSLETWMNTDAEKYYIPPVTISQNEASLAGKISSDINNYVSEMMSRFITGVDPLSKFESEYIPTLKKLSIEKLTALQQEAYDEFKSR